MKHLYYTILLASLLFSGSTWATVTVGDLKGLKNALNSGDKQIVIKATIAITEDTELDLRNKTITATTANAFNVTSAKLTLRNGVINSINEGNSTYTIILQTESKVVLENVSISSTCAAIGNYNGDELTINKGVTLHGGKHDFINVSPQFGSNHLSVIINDTFAIDQMSLYKPCTITNKGSLSIGNITSSAKSALKMINTLGKSVTLMNADMELGTFAIDNAGSFTIADGRYVNKMDIDNTGTLDFTGGLYAVGTVIAPLAFNSMQFYISPTHKAIVTTMDGRDARQVVEQTVTGEAVCDGLEYFSFAKAMQAANVSLSYDPTVTVLKNIDTCASLQIEQSLTLDISTFNVSLNTPDDSILVKAGTLVIRGTGNLKNSIVIDGSEASLDVDYATISGKTYSIIFHKANTIDIGSHATIHKGLVSAPTNLEKQCDKITNKSNCSISLKDTYIGNIVNQSIGKVELLDKCMFPKSASSLKAFVPSTHTVMLQADERYGDVYKVMTGNIPVMFKTGDYEFAGSEEGLNQALALSANTTPVVLQNNLKIDVVASTSGYLDINGNTWMTIAKNGLVIKRCTLTLIDASTNHQGKILSSCPESGSIAISVDSAIATIQNITIGNVTSDYGVYVTGPSVVDVSNCQIKAMKTGVEVRAGELNIHNSQVSSTTSRIACTPDADGPTTTGAAVAIAQSTAKQPIAVTVEDGSFSAPMTIIQVNPQNNTEADYKQLVVKVKGGYFMSTHTSAGALFTNQPGFGTVNYADSDMVVSKNHRVLLSGGYYNYDPMGYTDNGYASTEFNMIPRARRTAADTAAFLAGYNYKVVDENEVCYPMGNTVLDTLCLEDAQAKYPERDIKGSCTFADTVVATTGCDSIIMYKIQILSTPVLPELDEYIDLLAVKCGSNLDHTALMTAVSIEAAIMNPDTAAAFEDLWLEVQLDSASQFIKVTDSMQITTEQRQIQLRLVGQTACGDILYGNNYVSEVSPLTPDNTAELDSMPATIKHNKWLLMINHRQIVDSGYVFEEEDVTWYQVKGDVDVVGGLVDDSIVGMGYYYTADQQLQAQYYALITDHSSDCETILRTVVLNCTSSEKMELAPLCVRRGSNMTLSHLNADETTNISIYTVNGQLIEHMQTHGAVSRTIEANQSAGMYMLRAENGDQVETFKFIINQ